MAIRANTPPITVPAMATLGNDVLVVESEVDVGVGVDVDITAAAREEASILYFAALGFAETSEATASAIAASGTFAITSDPEEERHKFSWPAIYVN